MLLKFTGCLLLLSLGPALCACGKAQEFRLPEIPAGLTDPADCASYLSLHYWDHFNFRDRSLVGSELAEQAFVDFLGLLPSSSEARAAAGILFSRAAADRKMLLYLEELCDKYLYAPFSPMRSEELHVLMLTALVECPRVHESDKLRSRYLLELAGRNRPGDAAADFEVLLRDGSRLKMSWIEAPLLLVFFNDPDCRECMLLQKEIEESEVLGSMLASGQLKLLSVCVEGDIPGRKDAAVPSGWIAGCDADMHLMTGRLYDLQALPVLYLLDSGKNVILKDVSFGELEAFLMKCSCR